MKHVKDTVVDWIIIIVGLAFMAALAFWNSKKLKRTVMPTIVHDTASLTVLPGSKPDDFVKD
jgi:hypothetical protein